MLTIIKLILEGLKLYDILTKINIRRIHIIIFIFIFIIVIIYYIIYYQPINIINNKIKYNKQQEIFKSNEYTIFIQQQIMSSLNKCGFGTFLSWLVIYDNKLIFKDVYGCSDKSCIYMIPYNLSLPTIISRCYNKINKESGPFAEYNEEDIYNNFFYIDTDSLKYLNILKENNVYYLTLKEAKLNNYYFIANTMTCTKSKFTEVYFIITRESNDIVNIYTATNLIPKAFKCDIIYELKKIAHYYK